MLLDQQLHDDAALIEAHLDTLTKDFDRDYPALFASMRYSLLAGGKRIRPFLTLQFCRLFGGDEDAKPGDRLRALEQLRLIASADAKNGAAPTLTIRCEYV